MKYLYILLSVLILTSCGTSMPQVKTISSSQKSVFIIKQYPTTIPYQGSTNSIIKMPGEGEKNALGVQISPELKIAYDNYLNGDGQKSLKALNIANTKTQDTLTLFQISSLKIRAYMLMGENKEAHKEIKNLAKYEIQHFKHNLNASAFRGEVLMREGKFEESRQVLHNVLSEIGSWELPTSYGLPPSNIDELVAMTTAQIRSYVVIASSYMMQHKYKEAKVWAQEAESRLNAVHYISNHGLYGIFFKSYLDSYYGRAMNMIFLASAIVGSTDNEEKANFYYNEALKLFKKIGYKKGEIFVLSFKRQTLDYLRKYDTSKMVHLQGNSLLPNFKKNAKENKGLYKIQKYPDAIAYQGINSQSVTMPNINDKNALGIIITPELKVAYNNYLGGDGNKAMKALEIAQNNTKDTLTLFQISSLRVRVLMLKGMDADVHEELKSLSLYENKHFSHNLNTLAFKGEVLVREGRLEEAREIFNKVLNSIGDWNIPIKYGVPPSNISALVATTTAQIRSMVGMSGSYIMQNKYKEAEIWAVETEKRINAVHYLSAHPLYSTYFNSYLDSYYGRAMNMIFLSASLLGSDTDREKSEYYHLEALRFFQKISYEKGEIIALAIRSQTLFYLKQYEKADAIALQAIKLANKKKMYDFIWRIETLRGKILLENKEIDAAQIAFVNAANVIDLVSGDLKTDFSKRRFGTGKDDLVYNLMQINLTKKNYQQLFVDVENGRARAFVDIMRNRAVSPSNSGRLESIRAIDKKIKKLIIQNYSFGNMHTNVNMKEQDKLRKQRAILVQELVKLEPQASSIITSKHYSLQEIQKGLKNTESILYFLPVKANDKIKALYISHANVRLKTFAITGKELSNIMKSYLIKIGAYDNSLNTQMRSFKKKNKRVDAAGGKVKEPLNVLHTRLPLRDIQTKRLYIVGSGATTYVPWATYNKSLEISLLPNASWILNTSKKSHAKNVVIVGNPNYGGELDQLQGTVKEAQSLAKIYNVKPLLYKNATLKNITKNIGDGAKILHLATHGVFYTDKPLDSAIFLSKDSKLYTLTAKEIFKNPIKADLVVLSACETGMGANVAGDDLLGLPRSFFLGGTKAILSSLWPIDDEGTKEFMTEFHKYAKEGEYEKGLLKAKEHLKAKGYPASVYGAFVLYGMSL
ncbi:CHAT domain-containing protein [Sulfurimonas sp. SAG-AH-194-I05]|nr:CHAT domain-containing protein [Sulfurimonas sp. SAG-AH-194-I05]MDF1874277.1 CHAT domain-containing protein [Sulfurimonas sp. SAG-AH-194-I05]